MSNVSLTIGGRVFTVACAAGEEEHVARLGRMIHEKLAAMGDGGTQSEVRTLLFAALLLADEVEELRASRATAAPDPPPAQDEVLSSRVVRIAERLENLASRLEA